MDVFTFKNSEGLHRVTGSKKVLEEVIQKLMAYEGCSLTIETA